AICSQYCLPRWCSAWVLFGLCVLAYTAAASETVAAQTYLPDQSAIPEASVRTTTLESRTALAATNSLGPASSAGLATNPGAVFGSGFSEPDFLPVEEAYPLAIEQQSDRDLRLIWQMPNGYYLYRHALKFSARDSGETVGIASNIPDGQIREDEYFGRVEVYYSELQVGLAADSALAGTDITVTSQGCADAGLCYPPRTQVFRVTEDGLTEITPNPRAIADRISDSVGLHTSGAVAHSGVDLRVLAVMMLLAFAGGVILNLMPCVLPILSLKVISFTCAPARERHQHGLLYSLGVVFSFLLIALLLIGLRSGGQAIGWGFQLQSPGVVVGLAYLFVVLGLSLGGVVELGASFMNAGNGLAQRDGPIGSFFTGVLAVLVASPCTAPFMGSALGYALVRPASEGLVVFAALGAGMACPMLFLSYSSLARRVLPKPGPWTVKLKQFMAFPMYATALWLFWVAGRQVSIDFMAAALLGGLLLALGCWSFGRTLVTRSFAVVCVLLAVALATWRPDATSGDARQLPAGAVAYSPERLQELREQGREVFVDVTADWCITCLANEKAVLATTEVKDAFRRSGVVYMVADWTDYDPLIAEFVEAHGRSGIPLYVVYRTQQPPQVLPQILRSSTVLDAIGADAVEGLASR
ncbi:MAG: protein-disulfide reductase DsbD, partial [Pseudomonadota bacterium]